MTTDKNSKESSVLRDSISRTCLRLIPIQIHTSIVFYNTLFLRIIVITDLPVGDFSTDEPFLPSTTHVLLLDRNCCNLLWYSSVQCLHWKVLWWLASTSVLRPTGCRFFSFSPVCFFGEFLKRPNRDPSLACAWRNNPEGSNMSMTTVSSCTPPHQ